LTHLRPKKENGFRFGGARSAAKCPAKPKRAGSSASGAERLAYIFGVVMTGGVFLKDPTMDILGLEHLCYLSGTN
jgi:hypothetical protein